MRDKWRHPLNYFMVHMENFHWLEEEKKREAKEQKDADSKRSSS